MRVNNVLYTASNILILKQVECKQQRRMRTRSHHISDPSDGKHTF